jgi:hypothetical protein
MYSLRNKTTQDLVKFSISQLENDFHSKIILLGKNEDFTWLVKTKLEAEVMLDTPSLSSKTLWSYNFFPEEWEVVELKTKKV